MDLKSVIISKFVRKCPNTIEYKERLEKELDLVIKKNFVPYLLQVCEILELVKKVWIHL